ncbi:MAG: tyrosine-type recombinase/integrase [Solirubrobacteraceae bacterium]
MTAAALAIVPATDARLMPGVPRCADDVAAAYLAGFGTATREAYARDLRAWGCFLARASVPVLDARRVHVDAFCRAAEAEGVAPATLARRLTAMAGFYAYAADEGLIGRNPVDRVRRPRVSDESSRPGLDRDELRAMLRTAEADGARSHALVCLLGLNGLRVSEVVAADVGDLGHERGHRTLRVRRKGGKVATVPLAPRTAAAVDVLVGDREAGPIFATRTGRPMDRHAAWKVVRRLARAAGITAAISPHSFRHSFVTNALDAGVPLHVVQDGAGHADPRTTQRYNRRRRSLDGHATYAVAAFIAE